MSNQQLVYVSKAHMQSVKRLYKMILRLHKGLPNELQSIGNSYVRNEFKLHKNASPEHVQVFMAEWGNYTKTLFKQLNPKFGYKLGENLDSNKINEFNDNQITQLYELFLETKKPTKKP